jgi:hypothetical protein
MAAVRRVAIPMVTGLSLSIGGVLTGSTAAIADPSTAGTQTNTVHFFGDSSTVGDLGATYMVLETTGDSVVGGFYQPNSSFDCFQGEIQGHQLQLIVTDSYAVTDYAYTLALITDETVAAQTSTGHLPWVPAGFYDLSEPDVTAENVLQVCRTNR